MTKRHVNLSVSLPVPGPQGACSVQESATRCTRCNACVQSCPSYALRPQEMFSPRGRAQLMRLLTEGKLNINSDDPTLREIASSCLLCARCSAACAAQIPLAHHMIALRREIGFQPLPAGLRFLMRLYTLSPSSFDLIVRFSLFLRRLGLATIIKTFLPYWLKHLHTVLPKKTGSLRRRFIRQKISFQADKPHVLYLPSLYSQYADPQAGLLVWQLLEHKNPAALFEQATGLFEYVYGSRTRCLKTAKKLLRAWEQIAAGRDLPLVTDSIEIYGFLKNYPLLFNTIPGWKKRAEHFAAHVQFITDGAFPVKRKTFTARVALEDSSLLCAAQAQVARARKLLLTTYGKNLIECAYSRFSLLAGSMFARGNRANELLQRQVSEIASKQIDKIYCLSPWTALELNAALRKKYPGAQAQFIIYLRTEV